MVYTTASTVQIPASCSTAEAEGVANRVDSNKILNGPDLLVAFSTVLRVPSIPVRVLVSGISATKTKHESYLMIRCLGLKEWLNP